MESSADSFGASTVWHGRLARALLIEDARAGRPCHRQVLALLGFGALLLASASTSRAEISISFPLEGHYRPGRYMPVKIAAKDERGLVEFRARGAVTTRTEVAPGGQTLVPWLAVATLQDALWTGPSGAQNLDNILRPLGTDERLVGVAGENAALARPLFPGSPIVQVTLDVSDPLPGPPQAWETLDALMLSAAAFGRLDASKWQMLASAGTTIAVASSAAPDSRFPWQKRGDLWVLRLWPVGPMSVMEPAAYEPTNSWTPGWPASFRWGMVFAAAVFCILVTAVALWRSRWTILALLVVCGATGALVTWWSARQPPMRQLAAGVLNIDGPAAQYDLWTWNSPVRGCDGSMPLDGLVHPVFDSLRQLELERVMLACEQDPSAYHFEYHLDRGQSLAFMRRSLAQPSAVSLAPARGAFADFAGELYVRPPLAILGRYWVAPQAGQSGPTPIIVLAPVQAKSSPVR